MSCFLCNTHKNPALLFRSRDRMYGVGGWFEIRRCPTCNIFSVYPKLRQKEISMYYPSASYYSYVEKRNSVFRKLRRYLIKKFYHPTFFSKILFLFINTIPAIPELIKKGRIMDIGCGNGETLRNLKHYGWDTYGVDIDMQAVQYAKKHGLPHVTVGTHEYLSHYPDGYFDVIRSYHVIEHMDNPKKFISLAFKKLKPGGICIIGTPNAHSIAANLFRTYWYNLDTPRHQYIFSPKNLTQLVSNSKFHVTDLRYCSGGGFLGSIQYILSSWWNKRIDLINNPFLFFLFYPLDLLSDKMQVGDVFVLTARKP